MSFKGCISSVSEEFFFLPLSSKHPDAVVQLFSCSKLTTSLVNETLKFQTYFMQNICNFLQKQCEELWSGPYNFSAK